MIQTVLAGSGDFVAAVAPALRNRSGAEPRLAADPRQAFTICADSGGLLVFQYRGQEWLSVIRDLRSLCGDAISVVVAIEPERLEELADLQRAGADEVIPWDGRPDAVHWAVERILATRRARLAAPAPPPPGYLAPPSAGPLLPRMTPADGTPVAAEPPAPGAEPTATPLPAAVASSSPAAVPWPAGVPAGPEAEWLLLAALTGAASAPGPERQVADGIAQGLTDLERTAFQGTAIPEDAPLVRGASVLRLRVALALASAPPPGDPIDAGAVQALLAQLDEALARLKAAGEGAALPVQQGLEALRTALVHEAIDLTEVVQRLAPAEAALAAAPGPRPAAGQPAARLLSLRVEAARRPVPVGLLILLGIAAAAGGAFHLHRYLNRPAPHSFQYRGAPQDTVAATAGPGKPVVIVKDSGAFDPTEVEKLRAQEELKGRTVQQLAPGTLLIVPEKPAAAPEPAQPAAPPGGTP